MHVEQEKNLLLGKVEELESQVQEEREKCALQTEKVNALLDEKMERLAEHQVRQRKRFIATNNY